MADKKIHPYLIEVRDRKASDLLLTVNAPPQVRVKGLLEPLEAPSLGPKDIEQIMWEILNERQKQVLESYKTLDFSIDFPGISKFRINAYYQRGHLALAARIIPDRIPSPEELGLPRIVEEFADRCSGLFLVTGPAGSGKSTTARLHGRIGSIITAEHTSSPSKIRSSTNIIISYPWWISEKSAAMPNRSKVRYIVFSASLQMSLWLASYEIWKPSIWL